MHSAVYTGHSSEVKHFSAFFIAFWIHCDRVIQGQCIVIIAFCILCDKVIQGYCIFIIAPLLSYLRVLSIVITIMSYYIMSFSISILINKETLGSYSDESVQTSSQLNQQQNNCNCYIHLQLIITRTKVTDRTDIFFVSTASFQCAQAQFSFKYHSILTSELGDKCHTHTHIYITLILPVFTGSDTQHQIK